MIWLCLPAFAGFGAGSYGRIQASTDLTGGHSDALQIASYGPRLEKEPYLELDLWWDQLLDDNRAILMVTPAMEGSVFAYDGVWDASLALRNMYAELEFGDRIRVWAGARMHRGADLYLLDVWPLDDLNLMGAGTHINKSNLYFELAMGVNRLQSEWQVQTREVSESGGVGTETILTLDRQRVIGAAKGGGRVGGEEGGVDLAFYGELHLLPSGLRYTEELVQEQLPSDAGGVMGLELGFWKGSAWGQVWWSSRFGLAAWDELEVPLSGFATDYTTRGAMRHMLAASLGVNQGSWAVLAGGYGLRFVDADAIRDTEDRVELVGVVRPSVMVGQYTCLGLEVSDQWVRWDGINADTSSDAPGNLLKIGLIPALQLRPGPLERPQIRLQYVLSLANEAARARYPESDLRSQQAVSHYFGIGAEWWVNSRSYR